MLQQVTVFLIIWFTIGTAWFVFKIFQVEAHAPKLNRAPFVEWFEWPLFWASTATMWPYAIWLFYQGPKTQASRKDKA